MKKLLALSFPLIISQLVAAALVFTDVWMMSRLSVVDLAAGGLGAAVYNFTFLIAGSTVGCAANLIAIAYGQGIARPEHSKKQIRHVVKGGVLLTFLLSIVLIIGLSFTPLLLVKAQQPDDVVALAMEYINTLKWAMLPTMLLLVLRGLTSVLGDARSIMVMSLMTVIINVPISYLLAFTFDFGLGGLGAGTAIAATLAMLFYGYWIFAQQKYQQYAPWKNCHEYSLRLLAPLLALGLPIALASLLEHGLIYGGTLMAGMLSVTALALQQVLLQCLSFTWNINFGFCQGAAILVGRAYGAGDLASIRRTSWLSFMVVTVISLALSAVFVLWPDLIAAIFQLQDSEDGVSMTALFSAVLWVVALCFVADAWQLLAINLLRGMKIVITPTVMTAVGYWVCGIPAAWLLMKHYGLAGIWGGIGIGLAVTGILLLIIAMHAMTPKRFATLTR
ncbi:MATE family efflux transporter [Vibrio sp. 10N.286.49.B3]|uniref:MATE family efflux transporter n=1 Tax=Vibrio sp. 10N.286.49.B3 TaxID=1880855 RepID=UPI000C829701|nr:MATE family efflux transporter [Vibrio sp. 10N.286.49.B3]PMH44578.1 MATE family efflux transporter [Vibrio sp. 10N.286.49.B3]